MTLVCGCTPGETCSRLRRDITTRDGIVCRVKQISLRSDAEWQQDCDLYRVPEDWKRANAIVDAEKFKFVSPDDKINPILRDRGKEYGDYMMMCARIQAIKDGYGLSYKNLHTSYREALEMIATKIGRILTGNPDNVDSWTDIAGYATLAADVARRMSVKPGDIVKIPDGWEIDSGVGGPGFIHRGSGRVFKGTVEQLVAHVTPVVKIKLDQGD